jgi:hypothetical protein
MKDSTKLLISLTENEFAANQAILILQGYTPQNELDKIRLLEIRKHLIIMRDQSAEDANRVIVAIEGV